MNKRKGIEFLKEFNLNTIDLLSIKDLYDNPSLIKEGLSLRLSSYKNGIDVNLPSIHNVTNIENVLDFYQKYHNKFDLLTVWVSPGSIVTMTSESPACEKPKQAPSFK